jgi:predicted metal-binding membrane protein
MIGRLEKLLIIALVGTSGLGWTASQVFQVEMMSAMVQPNDAVKISVFVAVWTAGMAAMMFPAISPMVLLYNRLSKSGGGSQSVVVEETGNTVLGVKMILFIGSYLAVWSLTGIALLLAWSVSAAALAGVLNGALFGVFLGSILIVAGAYQFSPLKSKCLGYCESPMSFFMRRWKKGTSGALSMGLYHGLYCLGCCWPYFLIMVALGWMDILWMALFAGIILVEKIWSRGIWAARVAGAALIVTGVAVTVGLVNVQGNQMMSMTDSMPMENNSEEQMLNDQSPGIENSMDSKGSTEDPMTDKGMSDSGM